MKQSVASLTRTIQFVVGIFLCLFVLILPYYPRVLFLLFIAKAVHFPYLLIGRLTTYLLRQLKIEFQDAGGEDNV